MKNGTPFSKLTLVDRNGREIPVPDGEEEMAVEYLALPVSEEASTPQQAGNSQLTAFAAVSIGCTVAAVATGSYALWLSRRKITDDALTSVHDILKTCQDRVSQMEEDLSHLSARASSQNAAP